MDKKGETKIGLITPEEAALLERYESTMAQRNDPYRYDTFGKESLAKFCRVKDKVNDQLYRRCQAAWEVIDTVAEAVEIDPKGRELYTLDLDGESPLAKKVEAYISRSGEKAKLKKRVDELERENSMLRSVLRGE